MRTRSIFIGVVAASLLALGGCAYTTDRVAIQYAPEAGVSTLDGAKSVLVDVQVADNRADRSRVGTKKSGWGLEGSPIVPEEDVSITFRKAIEYELKARGFSLGQDAVVSINADLTRFYNDFKMGVFAGDAIAELNLGVTVKNKKGTLVYSRQFAAQGVEPNIQLMTGDNARLALQKALAEGMKNLFADRSFISALLAASKS